MSNPSPPLSNARHEAFALAVARGSKLGDAYLAAGFTCKQANARNRGYHLRHKPDVDARVKSLLVERVKADSRTFARRQKVKGDLLDATLKRLADIAHTDLRELLAWKDEPVVNADGEVTGTRQRLILRDSQSISPAAATLLKGAFLKAGELRIETHDQRAALVDLAKLLKGSDALPPTQNVTLNQVNIGQLGAVEAAQRVAFMLAAAGRTLAAPQPAQPVTIDATPTATQE